MKQIVLLVIATVFASLVFDCCAQTGDLKKTICGSHEADDPPYTRESLKGYVRSQCYGANTGNIGSAIEREVAKATRESSNRNERGKKTANNKTSSDNKPYGTSRGNASRESGGSGKSSCMGTSGMTSGNTSSSHSCSSCSSQANALRNSRNH